MEASIRQTAVRPGPTFAHSKPMASQDVPSSVRFCLLRPKHTRGPLLSNPSFGPTPPALDRSQSLIGLRWQFKSVPGVKRGRGLCRAEAPAKVEQLPDTGTPFRTVPDLAAYISQGPLVEKLGGDEKNVAKALSTWVDLGLKVCDDLGFDPATLNEAQKSRIFHYYLPTFFWCRSQLQQHRAQHAAAGASEPPPLLIGISAPQGCGKSTIVEELTSLFEYVGSHCAGISLDDFYLTASEQAKMAEFYEGNKLLQFRGNAGSHDMEFGRQCVERLLKLTQSGSTERVPRYDKSANQGRGDRADPATWPEVKGPLEVILFEGWMLGFRSMPTQHVAAVDKQLIPVNSFLEHYEETFDSLVGAWVVIQVADPRWVFKWRLQAEHAMRDKGKPTMTDEQVEDFCSRFQPAYKAYLPALYELGPPGAKKESTLQIRIDESRHVRK